MLPEGNLEWWTQRLQKRVGRKVKELEGILKQETPPQDLSAIKGSLDELHRRVKEEDQRPVPTQSVAPKGSTQAKLDDDARQELEMQLMWARWQCLENHVDAVLSISKGSMSAAKKEGVGIVKKSLDIANQVVTANNIGELESLSKQYGDLSKKVQSKSKTRKMFGNLMVGLGIFLFVAALASALTLAVLALPAIAVPAAVGLPLLANLAIVLSGSAVGLSMLGIGSATALYQGPRESAVSSTETVLSLMKKRPGIAKDKPAATSDASSKEDGELQRRHAKSSRAGAARAGMRGRSNEGDRKTDDVRVGPTLPKTR